MEKKSIKFCFSMRLLSLLACVFWLAVSTNSAAAEDPRQSAQDIITESIEALWSGQAFSRQLQQKQQTLQTMLDGKSVTGGDLERMTGNAVNTLMNRKKISRDTFRNMPGRVNELLASHLEWEMFRKILWQSAASKVDDGRRVVVTVGTLAPAGTPWISVPEQMSAAIEEFSDKRFSIKIFSGGVMGEDPDILEKMAQDQLDGCGCTALGILQAFPEAAVFLLPGLFNSYDEVDHVFEKFRTRIDQAFEKKGYVLAGWFDTGNFYVFSKNRVSGLADLRRSKVLTWFGTVETTLFEELGISAMPISVPEIVTALSTGMADTNVAPASWMLGMQAYQYANYFIEKPFFYSPAAVLYSTKTRERLQKQLALSDIFAHNLQELLVVEVSLLETEWKRQLRRYEARCLEAFTTRIGMQALTLPAEDRKVIEQAGRRTWDRLAGDTFPREFLEDILSTLEAYRQKQ